ncbi:type I polyketide synthase, partial [Protofrankia symbiont of Coriaria ruscifolia]|uniref:type I polyketide synthase n=1 Tax=Protofrankia symbiont of Coriaria ruscifolia TaxID=1306542 RepID=UPI001F5FEDC6
MPGPDRSLNPDSGIAIVGMAAVFPGAGDLDTYWNNIVTGVDAIREVSPQRFDPEFFHAGSEPGSGDGPTAAGDRIHCRRGGFVEEFATFDPTRFGIVPLAVDWAEPDQLMALRVAAEAIADAGGEDALGDRDRTGVVLGRGGYFGSGMARLDQRVKVSTQLVTSLSELVPTLTAEQLARVHAAFTETLGPHRPEAAIGLVPNLAASRIANRLDLHGPAYTLDAACASSLIAVETAVRELTGGRADAMIVGGVHLVQEVTFWSVFSLLRALSPSSRIRPFDRRADGILIGEGVGMVVLKRLADAERAGDRIYAVIRGCGSASDGRTSTLLAPASDGQMLAVERAWADAGLDPKAPGALGLVEAHGTAAPAGDTAELATLRRIFGMSEGAQPIGVGSVKSMIGHAMPAAGAAGLIKAALALHHRTLPPTLHCEQPHPAFAGTRLRPVLEADAWDVDDGSPRRAGVNAFGFGGINAHVVVEEAPQPSNAPSIAFPVPPAELSVEPSAEPGVERVLLLAGASPAEIARALAVPDRELLARDDATAPPDGGPYRLAIVAPDRRRLALARTVVERGRPWRGRNDLWFTGSPLLGGAAEPGRTAFLFCGLEDNFHPRVDDVSAYFALTRPNAPSAAGAGTGSGDTGSGNTGTGDTRVLGEHGVASVEVGRILDTALRRMEILPDLVGGHSIGEWNAMISAGLIDDEHVDRFINSFEPYSLEVPGVAFGALGCGADMAAATIAELPDVVVSHDNCPHQSIICGEERSVETALQRLRGRGVLGRILPFRSGFHSPFLSPFLAKVRADVASTPIRPPSVPVWSATTAAPYPEDHEGIRELTVRHLLEPVRFRQLTERLYAEGVRVFVQVGVGSIAGFVQDTLPGREHLTVVTNTPKRPGLDQLRRVAAALWAEGAAPRMDLLPCADPPAAAPVPVSRPQQPSPSLPSPLSPPAARDSAEAAVGEPESPPAHRGRPMLLNLGAPLVRLGERAASLMPAAPAPDPDPDPLVAHPHARPLPSTTTRGLGPPVSQEKRDRAAFGPPAGGHDVAGHPVLAEFDALVTETNEMVSAVLAQWAASAPATAGTHTPVAAQAPPARPATGPATGPGGRPAPPAGAPAGPPVPPAGSPVPPDGRNVRHVRRTLSIETMPYIIDHCFYRQPPRWPHLVDRFPVVPMTAVLELMIDQARAVVPDRVVVGVTDVRALRWLAIEPAVEVTVTATILPAAAGQDAVRV